MRIIKIIGYFFCVLLLSENAVSQNRIPCQYPGLGYYKLFGDAHLQLKDFYELTIGYVGEDRTEEIVEEFSLPLRGSLSVIDPTKPVDKSQPAFTVSGTPEIRTDVVKLTFEQAMLTIDSQCNSSIKLVTAKVDEKRYLFTLTLYRKYIRQNKDLYNLKGTVEIQQGNQITFQGRIKLIASRE